MEFDSLMHILVSAVKAGAHQGDSVYEYIEQWIGAKKVNFSEFKKHVAKSVKADELHPQIACSLALWMIERGGGDGPLHGEKLLRSLAADGDPVCMLNLITFAMKAGDIGNKSGEYVAMCKKIERDTKLHVEARAKAMLIAGEIYEHFSPNRYPMYEEAIEAFETAADLGSGEGAFRAAIYYDGKIAGYGGKKNFSKAARMYEIGVKHGDLKSQTNLGILHFMGAIPNFDESYGESLLRKSIVEGDKIAELSLESLTQVKNDSKIFNQTVYVKDLEPESSDEFFSITANDIPEFVSCMKEDEFSIEMPDVALIFEKNYLHWLERKNWDIGEIIGDMKRDANPKWLTSVHYICHCLEEWKKDKSLTTTMDTQIADIINTREVDSKPFLVSIKESLVDIQWKQIVHSSAGEIQHGPEGRHLRHNEWESILSKETGLRDIKSVSRALNDDTSILSKGVASFLHRLLVKKISDKAIRWFFERPCDVDGFRECNPGYPGVPYLENGAGTLLNSNRVVKTVWASNTTRGLVFTATAQRTEFQVERINEKTRFVSAKVVGDVYGSKNPNAKAITKDDILQTAYAYSQSNLLDMVSAIGCGINLDQLSANPFAVIECMERNQNGKKGSGIETLRHALRKVKAEWPSLQNVLFKMQPLQYSVLIGIEPLEVIQDIKSKSAKIIDYLKGSGLEDELGIKMVFYTPYLSGDLLDHVNSGKLSPEQKAAISMGIKTRTQRRSLF